MRALIDQDVVQPREGVYRLVGEVGELAVPDSLHALLASRLDALDPGVRHLVSDAAVLGSTFPAEALIAVSGRDEPTVRAALSLLVLREVFSVSADPLSPERGSYQFSQQMLRQVAYDTMSRHDRKTRHLKVAAHLRAAFAGDGEEVTDVIARHYLDAIDAVPDDPDADEIRDRAVGALIRAGERAERTGAPAMAAISFATAAEMTRSNAEDGQLAAPDAAPAAGLLWERAALAAVTNGNWAPAIEHARRARDVQLERGHTRAAARAQAIAGDALVLWGHHREARDQLTAAVEVLRAEPDGDTVRALERLAALEAFAGSPDADRLSNEALILGQALGVSAAQLGRLLLTRGFYLGFAGRLPEACAYFRESARLAGDAGDNMALGRALLNLADTLVKTDPAAAADAARTAAGHLRRAGARDLLAYAVGNLVQALLALGEWDAAAQELAQAADSDGLSDHDHLACDRAWLAALRGDADAAETVLAGLSDWRASEDEQEKAAVRIVEAFTAAARRRTDTALDYARSALAGAGTVGISHDYLRWGWPLAERCAYELDDGSATLELLVMLDSYPPGHVAPVQQAERELVRARMAGVEVGPAADAAFASAVSSLRELSTPFHLAHGLLDQAKYLVSRGEAAEAAAAVEEAREIAARLRCGPLLDRAENLMPAEPRVST